MLPSHQQIEQINEEIEEIRELVYDIVKEYPTGITSTFLEQQFINKYVKNGLASILPTNWLTLLRHAEEFQVRNVSTYTILYLADAKIPQQQQQPWEMRDSILSKVNNNSVDSNIEASSSQISLQNPKQPFSVSTVDQNGNPIESAEIFKKDNMDEAVQENYLPIANFTVNDLETIQITTMPVKGPINIHIISALDPDTIFFRLNTWDPYCEYLYAALSRLPSCSKNALILEAGQILGAKFDGKWERVELIRQLANPNFWVVYLVDSGFYSAIHHNGLRPLTDAVIAFKKIFLSICKLDGVQSRTQQQHTSCSADGTQQRVRWPPETEHYVSEALQPTTLKNKQVEFIPTDEWQIHEGRKIPKCSGKLLIDGTDFGEQLISMGLAQKS